MSLSHLEIQYSPSQWSKRFSAKDVLEHYNKFIKEASEKTQLSAACTRNIPYGPRDNEKFDIFGADLNDDVPIVVFIHGGYWQDYSRSTSSYVAESLIKSSIRVIVVGFDLCPTVSLFQLVDQVKNALVKCVDLAKKWKSRGIYIMGHSSGAHLVATLFDKFFAEINETDKVLVKAAFLISGIYDIQPLVYTYANEALKLNLNDAKALSPIHNPINVKNLEIIFIVPEHESPTFKKQSESFYEKVKITENRVDFKVISNVDHFDVVEKLVDENYELIKIILEVIKNTK